MSGKSRLPVKLNIKVQSHVAVGCLTTFEILDADGNMISSFETQSYEDGKRMRDALEVVVEVINNEEKPNDK